jgi:CRISPR-associated endonuclease Cas2
MDTLSINDYYIRKTYLICYDVRSPKRLSKVRKYLYALAFGGQKSALVIPLNAKELAAVKLRLENICRKRDVINIIEVKEKPICFGKNDYIKFEEGAIII